jgi:hypothetical protein
MAFERAFQSWRIEIENWDRQERLILSELMRLAGEHGGEWWGGGRFEFSSSDRAFECAARLRERGLRAQVILRVMGSSAGH